MSDERPNILWFCTDQQRFDTIGALGNPHVQTPTLDALVKGGTAFTHAYCQSPICTPSRASFLTGCYPSTVQVTRNGNDTFRSHYPLVTKTLADHGYVCGNVGKLHLAGAYRRKEPRADDGYSYFQYSHAPRDNWAPGEHDYADWVRAKGHSLAELTKSLDGVPAELHQTTWCVEKSIEFVRAQAGRPWLLSVNPYDPHPPFNPPKDYRARFDPAAMPGPQYRPSDLEQQAKLAAIDFQSKARDPAELDIKNPIVPIGAEDRTTETPGARDAKTLQAAYYAMIALLDDQLARLVAALDETGQRERTLIVFTSDHGETLGDHGLIQKGCRFYEGLVRVPLICNWPGRVAEGLVSDALVELTDKPATFLDFLGLERPEWMQGKSLRPILEGRADPHRHRDFVRSEYFDAVDLPDASRATMYRDRRYKLVCYHGHGLGELFDLEADPWEFDNLWDVPEHQGLKLELLQASFDSAMAAVGVGTKRIGPM